MKNFANMRNEQIHAAPKSDCLVFVQQKINIMHAKEKCAIFAWAVEKTYSHVSIKRHGAKS